MTTSNQTEFSTRALKNILKSETSKRVSPDSAVVLAEELESIAMKLTGDALKYAKEDGRKTIRQIDIRKAIRDNSELEVNQKTSIEVEN